MRLSSWTRPRRDRREQVMCAFKQYENVLLYVQIRVKVSPQVGT
jgi:hypothetical protein